jgi:ATP-dependent 26S proteasome regulatory subunit
MIALRKGQSKIGHENYVDAIAEVQAKKKDTNMGTQAEGAYIHEMTRDIKKRQQSREGRVDRGIKSKTVCVEAGMIALRKGQSKIGHENYVDAIAEVQAKKKDVHAIHA